MSNIIKCKKLITFKLIPYYWINKLIKWLTLKFITFIQVAIKIDIYLHFTIFSISNISWKHLVILTFVSKYSIILRSHMSNKNIINGIIYRIYIDVIAGAVEEFKNEMSFRIHNLCQWIQTWKTTTWQGIFLFPLQIVSYFLLRILWNHVFHGRGVGVCQ